MLNPEQPTPYHGLTWALDQPVDWRDKAMPPTDGPVTPRSARRQGWNVLAGDLFFPVVVLHEHALEHNLTRMAVLCARHGVSLAPHAKTYMAPQILARQLELGAWAATVATASQARIIRGFGIDRVLLANQLVQPAALRWVAGELDADEGFSFYCLADSAAGVSLIAVQPRRRLAVLVELGAPATRAGSSRDRCCTRPVSASASSTRSRSTMRVNTPIPDPIRDPLTRNWRVFRCIFHYWEGATQRNTQESDAPNPRSCPHNVGRVACGNVDENESGCLIERYWAHSRWRSRF